MVEAEFGDICRSFSTNVLTEAWRNLTKILENEMEVPINLSALGLYGFRCENFSDYFFYSEILSVSLALQIDFWAVLWFNFNF